MLLLILSMAGVGIGADWAFTIFKALQSLVLFWVVCGDALTRMVRELHFKVALKFRSNSESSIDNMYTFSQNSCN